MTTNCHHFARLTLSHSLNLYPVHIDSNHITAR